MKTILTTYMILLTVFAHSQSAIEREVIIEAPNKSKTEIMTAARLFLVGAFKDSKEVIQMIDEGAGIIAGKGSFEYEFSHGRFTCNRNNGKGYVRFTIKVFAKEDSTKLELTDFIHSSEDPNVNLGLITDKPPIAEFMQKCNTDIYYDVLRQIVKCEQRLTQAYEKELSEDNDW